MISHIVLLKLRKSLSEDEYQQFSQGLEQLKQIPGVVSVHYGKQEDMYADYNDRSKGFTHALVVVLKDKAALAAYDSNPLHVVVKKNNIIPYLDDTTTDVNMAVDFQFEGEGKATVFSSSPFFVGLSAVLAVSTGVLLWQRSRL